MTRPMKPIRSTEDDWLWELAFEFSAEAGICGRSEEWHADEPCETCQGLVNFARRAIAEQARSTPAPGDAETLIKRLRRLRQQIALPSRHPGYVHRVDLEDALAKFQQQLTYVLAESRRLAGEQDVSLEDLRAILQALGLFDGAQPISAHQIVHEKVLPAIGRLAGEVAQLQQENADLRARRP